MAEGGEIGRVLAHRRAVVAGDEVALLQLAKLLQHLPRRAQLGERGVAVGLGSLAGIAEVCLVAVGARLVPESAVAEAAEVAEDKVLVIHAVFIVCVSAESLF